MGHCSSADPHAPLGVVVALRREIPALFYGPATNAHLRLLVCGMGPQRAHRATVRFCASFSPRALLVLGVCGGLSPLRLGDLVLPAEVTDGRAMLPLDALLRERAHRALSIARLTTHAAALQTFPHPVLSARDVPPGLCAVDMEAYAIANAAHAYAIPVVILKAVSDLIPLRLTPRTLWRWLTHLGPGFRCAKQALDHAAEALLRELA